MVTRSRFVRGVFLALLGGVGWAFSGTCAEYLFEEFAVRTDWLTAVRMTISGVLFILLALAIDRKRSPTLWPSAIPTAAPPPCFP